VVVAGCGENNTRSGSATPEAASGIDLKPDTTGTREVPGALARANTLPTIDRRLRTVTSLAARIEYTSTSGITNSRTQVTGTVFVPKGKPPEAGWPIVVYGHPTSGTLPQCAPSLSPTLLGASVPIVTMVNAGYVVTVPDYQGLGVEGSHHPYLDSTTAGYNVIDSVRAVRRLVPNASDRWLAIGLSQGGQAAWAANELAADYGAGMSLLGTVSIAAPTDLRGFADLGASGTLSKDQQGAFQAILASLADENPGFNLDDYRRGVVADKWAVLSACDGPAVAQRAAAIDQIGPDDLRPSSPDAVALLRGYLEKRSLPQRRTSAPMLVIYGDADSLIPSAWTGGALLAACGMGDVIDIQFQPGKGHSDIDISMAFGWINDRFAGLLAPNSCESFTAAEEPGQAAGASTEQSGATSGDYEVVTRDAGELGAVG
jgi:pimeloyl-ACP methyl ester carboxylesterase